MAKHLMLSLEPIADSNMFGGIDESGAKIEKQEIMRVFDPEHPRPARALGIDEAITKLLRGK